MVKNKKTPIFHTEGLFQPKAVVKAEMVLKTLHESNGGFWYFAPSHKYKQILLDSHSPDRDPTSSTDGENL